MKVHFFDTKKKQLALLFDPEKLQISEVERIAGLAQKNGIDFFLVGGSLVSDYLDRTIETIKKVSDLPIYLFPGSIIQVSEKADGILFISLISGRNPEFLIGNHVIIAPFLKKTPLDIVPTGYLLIESSETTSVEYMSNTKPIPKNKPEIAVATALAGELLGLKMIYADAGSGASVPISEKMISEMKNALNIPLIIGGGIRNENALRTAFSAGADIVIIGTAFEQNSGLIEKFCTVKNEFNA